MYWRRSWALDRWRPPLQHQRLSGPDFNLIRPPSVQCSHAPARPSPPSNAFDLRTSMKTPIQTPAIWIPAPPPQCTQCNCVGATLHHPCQYLSLDHRPASLFTKWATMTWVQGGVLVVRCPLF